MERLKDITHLLSEHSEIHASQLHLLWELLNPPQDLTRLKLVLLNLQKLLNAKTVDLTIFLKEVDQQFDLHTITELLNRLESLENELPQELLDLNTGTRGFTDEHPEWAMLIMSPHNVYFDDLAFRSHQWVVLQCAIVQRLRLNVGEITSIGTEISTACRNIRYLALGKTKVSDLPEVNSFSSLISYQRSFVKKDSKPLKMFMGIELLTRKVADHIGKSRERTGNNLSDRVKHVIQQYEDDDPSGPSQQIRYFQSLYRQKDLENARSQGLHPDEFVTESSISIAYDKDKPLAGYEPVDHVRRQSAQIKHIAKANQRLPFRYPQLNAVELSWLGYHLAKLFRTKNDISKHIEYPEHVATLLMLMLWLGRPVDQLLSLRIYKREADLPSGKEGLVAYLIEEDSFVIPIPTPEWKNRLSEKAQSILYNAFDGEPVMLNDVIIVASPVNIGRFLDYLYCVNPRPKRVNYVPAFPDVSHEFYMNGAKRFLSKLNESGKYRLTLDRLNQTLFDQIYECSSDLTDAYMLTGHQFTITEVSSHYYHVDGEYLRLLFHQASIRLRDRLYQHLNIEEQNFFNYVQKHSNRKDLGSRLNLKTGLLSELCKHLKHKLREAKRLPPGDNRLIAIHNCLTLYVCYWVLFETGYRAVNDLIFDLTEIDLETGFIVISDKDNESHSHARLSWISQELREQLKCYLLHLEQLALSTSQHPTVKDRIEDVLSHHQPNTPLLFLLSETFQWGAITPSKLRDLTPEFPLPININRHFLRSQLRKKGCMGEHVDAFMGHWQQGQEPFGRFSSLSPEELFNSLIPALDEIRKETGWSTQSGLADDI